MNPALTSSVRMGRQRSMKRVTVNPNRVSRKNPAWTVVGFEEVGEQLTVGERVVAVQPDPDGNFVTTAQVERLDADNHLAFLSVDWASFAVESPRYEHSVARAGRVRFFTPPRSGGTQDNVRLVPRFVA